MLTQKIPLKQRNLNQSLIAAAEMCSVAEVQKLIAEGADIYYMDEDGYNSLYGAIERDNLEVAVMLLEMGMGNDHQNVGAALICARKPEAIKLLAKYNPDCTATKTDGLSASDVMVWNKEYDLLEAYDSCGLARPPVKEKVRRHIEERCDLKQWAVWRQIEVPDHCYKMMTDYDAENTCLHPIAYHKRKKLFQQIISEVEALYA